jgi:SAM-dependent methyltransferase
MIDILKSAKKEDILEKVRECPICSSSDEKFKKLYETPIGPKHSIGVMKCMNCSLVFKEYFPSAYLLKLIYSDQYVHFNIPIALTDLTDYQLQSAINRYKRLKIKPFSKVLDVGCGNGTMILAGLHLGYDCYGIDPFLPDMLANHPVLSERTFKSDLISISVPETLKEFDFITMWYVGEHLTSVYPFFKALRNILKDGGRLSLLVPYGDSLAIKIYKSRWKETLLVEHNIFYTKESLYQIFKRTGFRGYHDIKFRIAGVPFPLGFKENTLINQGFRLNRIVKKKENENTSLIKKLIIHPSFASLSRRIVSILAIGDYLEAVVEA